MLYAVFALIVALSSLLIVMLNHPTMTSIASPVARVGFDILPKMVHAIHCSIHPVNHSTIAVVLAVGRKIKSSFTASLGKQKTGHDNTNTPAKQQGNIPAITPLLALSDGTTAPHLSSSDGDGAPTPRPSVTLRSSVPLTMHLGSGQVNNNHDKPCHFSYLLDVGLVPNHPSWQPLVLQLIYKQLPPDDGVRLSAGDKLIIVIPTAVGKMPVDVRKGFQYYAHAFANVAFKTLMQMEPDKFVEQDTINKRHRLKWEVRWFVKYPV
jgi:hypothetical protein